MNLKLTAIRHHRTPRYLIGVIGLVVLFNSCKNEPSAAKLPNDPESVVQFWQDCIDKNQFDLARQLSTAAALNYIAELSNYADGDTLEWETNVMLNVNCQIFGDSAICDYHFRDELGEPEPGRLALKRVKGQWKVSRVDFDFEVSTDTSFQNKSELLFPGDTLELE